MKKSQLRQIIRESIKELITEQTEPPVGSPIYVPKYKICYINQTPELPGWSQATINVAGNVGDISYCPMWGTPPETTNIWIHDGNPLDPNDVGKSFDWANVTFGSFTNNMASYGTGKIFATIIDVCTANYAPNPGPNPPIFINTFTESCPTPIPTNADILTPADPILPPKPTTSPALLPCDKFYTMSQQYQNGCCMKCQDPNITPNHQCYPHCHCCSKLKQKTK